MQRLRVHYNIYIRITRLPINPQYKYIIVPFSFRAAESQLMPIATTESQGAATALGQTGMGLVFQALLKRGCQISAASNEGASGAMVQ